MIHASRVCIYTMHPVYGNVYVLVSVLHRYVCECVASLCMNVISLLNIIFTVTRLVGFQ